MFNKEKGITLIALIVTIVVLIILAGITIAGGIQGIDKANDNKLISDLDKVHHAITERETKYKLTKDASLLVGTKVTVSSLTNVPSSIKWKINGFDSVNNPEREYYRLNKSDLAKIGLTSDIDQNASFIVNYYTGEVYNEVNKTTSGDQVLYVSSATEEVSKIGDEIITDGLLVWYDGENNTGNGHSSTTTVWKDLSGNGNDAQITTTGSSLNWKSDCLSTNKAESIITPWTFSTSHTISVVFEPLAFYNYNTIWENSLSEDDNEAWIVGRNGEGLLKARSNYFYTNEYIYSTKLNTIIHFDIVADNENNKCYAYINGINYGNLNGGINLNDGKLIFNGGIKNTFGKNNYYSMNVYNRALSEDEIHHNYLIDKARFGIEE